MSESTTKLVFEGDVGKAVLGIVKLVEKMKEAKGEVKDFGRVSKDTDILGESINKATNSAKNFIMGFATVGGITAEIRALVEHMKEIAALRSKLAGTTETVEQLGLKLAALRGDVSRAGVAGVIKEATTRAMGAGIPLALSSQIGLSAETLMGKGTAGAKTAAGTIARFAGPMGLGGAEVDNLARLFQLEGATTTAAQEKILNKLMAAQGGSKATMGQYLTPFVSGYVGEKRKGLNLDQALAMNTAAIEATGSVEQAGSVQELLIRLLTEPAAKGFKFLKGQGRREGVDYMGLDTTQRIEFGRKLYGEYEQAGKLDIFRTKMGIRGAGFEGIEAMFSGPAQAKQAETFKAMQQETEYVNKLAAAYGELSTKRSAVAGTREMAADYRAGGKFEGTKLLDQMAAGFVERTHAEPMSFMERYIEFRIPDFIERAFVKHEIMRSGIQAVNENAPAANRPGTAMTEMAVFMNFFSTEFIERLAKLTNDFQIGAADFKNAVKDMNSPGGAGPHIETRE